MRKFFMRALGLDPNEKNEKAAIQNSNAQAGIVDNIRAYEKTMGIMASELRVAMGRIPRESEHLLQMRSTDIKSVMADIKMARMKLAGLRNAAKIGRDVGQNAKITASMRATRQATQGMLDSTMCDEEIDETMDGLRRANDSMANVNERIAEMGTDPDLNESSLLDESCGYSVSVEEMVALSREGSVNTESEEGDRFTTELDLALGRGSRHANSSDVAELDRAREHYVRARDAHRGIINMPDVPGSVSATSAQTTSSGWQL